MPRTWARPDLTGTRNGVNLSFSIPSMPDGGMVWIVFNGRLLFEVSLSPDSLQYSRTGAAVVLGLAPTATDTLWAYVVDEGEAVLTTAIQLVQEQRRVFYYNVEARDKADVLHEIIEKDISSTRWSYYPIGGCGDADIVLRRPFDDFGQLALDWDIQIWREPDILGKAGAQLPAQLPIQLGTAHQGTRELRYSGFVREIQRVCADDEQVVIRCAGYSRQLNYIFIPEQETPWQGMDVAAIVRDIIYRFVIPGTKITLDENLVPNTGITIDSSINFDHTAYDAIRLLGEIAGNAEWGVDAQRRFYFLQPANQAKQTHVIGDRISLYRPATNTDDIVKTVYVRGANGQKFVFNYGTPEAGFHKQRREFVAALQSEDVAALWGAAYFARHGESHPSGQLQLGETDDWIERVGHPLGLLRVIGGPVFVSPGDPLGSSAASAGFQPGAFQLGAFQSTTPAAGAALPLLLGAVYGRYTDESFRIASISYQPTDNALAVDIGLGERKRPLADLFETINYKLGQLAQAQGLT
jgi:hypothetical protein